MASAEQPSCRGPGRLARNTHFSNRLAYLRTTLAPLVSITEHTAHPDFPTTMLHYHLLTSPQLDALARHYHQSSPKAESWSYPVSIVGRWTVPSTGAEPTTAASPTPHSSTTTTTTTTWPALDLSAAIMGLEPPRPRTTGCQRTTCQKPSVKDRKRRFGRFIGLVGCESPTVSKAEAMRQEGRCVDLWVEREVVRRARQEQGPKGVMF